MKKKAVFIGHGDRERGMGHLVRLYALSNHFIPHYTLSIKVNMDHHGDFFFHQNDKTVSKFKNNRDLLKQLKADQTSHVMVVDLYPPRMDLLAELRSFCENIICFDDMKHLEPGGLDIVLVQPQETFKKKIRSRGKSTVVAGADYFPIRGNIIAVREKREFREEVKNVVVLIGGVPQKKKLHELSTLIARAMGADRHLYVVGGYHQGKQKKTDGLPGISWIENIQDMGDFLSPMDMGIIAGGFVKFELMCLGIPFGMVSLCEHQEILAKHFSSEGLGKYFGTLDDCLAQPGDFSDKMNHLIDDMAWRHSFHQRSRKLVDGRGGKRLKGIVNHLCKGKKIQ